MPILPWIINLPWILIGHSSTYFKNWLGRRIKYNSYILNTLNIIACNLSVRCISNVILANCITPFRRVINNSSQTVIVLCHYHLIIFLECLINDFFIWTLHFIDGRKICCCVCNRGNMSKNLFITKALKIMLINLFKIFVIV